MFAFKPINLDQSFFFGAAFVVESPLSVGDSFNKAFMEEWIFISDDERTDEQPGFLNNAVLYPVCEPTIPRDNPYFWERLEAPLRPLRPPQQLSPFPERLELPFSSDAILSGYEDIVSSGSDHFTTWVKVSPREILAEHVVDVQKVMADFREASE